jgi:hypothetical protein
MAVSSYLNFGEIQIGGAGSGSGAKSQNSAIEIHLLEKHEQAYQN